MQLVGEGVVLLIDLLRVIALTRGLGTEAHLNG